MIYPTAAFAKAWPLCSFLASHVELQLCNWIEQAHYTSSFFIVRLCSPFPTMSQHVHIIHRLSPSSQTVQFTGCEPAQTQRRQWTRYWLCLHCSVNLDQRTKSVKWIIVIVGEFWKYWSSALYSRSTVYLMSSLSGETCTPKWAEPHVWRQFEWLTSYFMTLWQKSQLKISFQSFLNGISPSSFLTSANGRSSGVLMCPKCRTAVMW